MAELVFATTAPPYGKAEENIVVACTFPKIGYTPTSEGDRGECGQEYTLNDKQGLRDHAAYHGYDTWLAVNTWG